MWLLPRHRTAQAGVRVPRSQGVPSADRPGGSRGGPVRRPPGAGGSRGSGGRRAVVERAQACGASAEWPERAEQRRGWESGTGQRRRDGCVSKRRDGSGNCNVPTVTGIHNSRTAAENSLFYAIQSRSNPIIIGGASGSGISMWIFDLSSARRNWIGTSAPGSWASSARSLTRRPSA